MKLFIRSYHSFSYSNQIGDFPRKSSMHAMKNKRVYTLLLTCSENRLANEDQKFKSK
jgi:carbonic anhydrase